MDGDVGCGIERPANRFVLGQHLRFLAHAFQPPAVFRRAGVEVAKLFLDRRLFTRQDGAQLVSFELAIDDLRKLQMQTLQDGGPFVAYADASSTSKKRNRILKVAGIPPITIHDLRRTGITRALLAGVPPITVQKLAGHQDIKTTMQYYAQVNFDDLRAGVEKQRAALVV